MSSLLVFSICTFGKFVFHHFHKYLSLQSNEFILSFNLWQERYVFFECVHALKRFEQLNSNLFYYFFYLLYLNVETEKLLYTRKYFQKVYLDSLLKDYNNYLIERMNEMIIYSCINFFDLPINIKVKANLYFMIIRRV